MQTSLNIKEPGLNVFPLGVERYVVNGGGLTGVQILPDDEIEIINDEGNQICEIICFIFCILNDLAFFKDRSNNFFLSPAIGIVVLQFSNKLILNGRIISLEPYSLISKINEEVKIIHVLEGAEVVKGQKLIELENEILACSHK